MKTGPKGIEIIKHFEGCSAKAYLCPAKKWTIGIGTTVYPDGRKVSEGDVCTSQQAYQYLMSDLENFEKKLNRHFKTLNQDQFDALSSWVYNLGFGNLLSSTLKSKILNNPNNFDEIGKEWIKWCHVGKVKSEGLLRRRKSEFYLYSTGNLMFKF